MRILSKLIIGLIIIWTIGMIIFFPSPITKIEKPDNYFGNYKKEVYSKNLDTIAKQTIVLEHKFNSKLFKQYYLNLLTMTDIYGEIPIKTEDLLYEEFIEYFKNNMIDERTPALIKVDSGHHLWVGFIDYSYLLNSYSEELDADWVDFLTLNKEEYDIINKDKLYPTGYYLDGISYDISLIPIFIQKRRNFIQTHPKFPLNYLNEKQIDIFLKDFISDKWQTIDYSTDYPKPYTTKVLKLYQDFKQGDERENKIINTWYTVLKANNFKETKEILDIKEQNLLFK